MSEASNDSQVSQRILFNCKRPMWSTQLKPNLSFPFLRSPLFNMGPICQFLRHPFLIRSAVLQARSQFEIDLWLKPNLTRLITGFLLQKCPIVHYGSQTIWRPSLHHLLRTAPAWQCYQRRPSGHSAWRFRAYVGLFSTLLGRWRQARALVRILQPCGWMGAQIQRYISSGWCILPMWLCFPDQHRNICEDTWSRG